MLDSIFVQLVSHLHYHCKACLSCFSCHQIPVFYPFSYLVWFLFSIRAFPSKCHLFSSLVLVFALALVSQQVQLAQRERLKILLLRLVYQMEILWVLGSHLETPQALASHVRIPQILATHWWILRVSAFQLELSLALAFVSQLALPPVSQ